MPCVLVTNFILSLKIYFIVKRKPLKIQENEMFKEQIIPS